MLPWTLIGSARVPADGGEMRLYRRGSELAIRVGQYELMNSRVHESEDLLASLVAERLPDAANARVLIGGLGMGFTLAAMLRVAGRAGRIEVAELVPEVVEWNRGPLAEVAGRPLDDARVAVHVEDVARVIANARDAYDAILLDVDNGPAALTSKGNSRLYTAAGLRSASAALRAGGILAIWSAGPDAAFARRLAQSGLATEEVKVRRHRTDRRPSHVIWLCRRRG
jgi:spermidine synthase